MSASLSAEKWGKCCFPKRTNINLALAIGLSLALWASTFLLYLDTTPLFLGETVNFPEKPAQRFKEPFGQKSVLRTHFIVREIIVLPPLHPSTFSFYPQDVLWTLKVNGHNVYTKDLPITIQQHGGHSLCLSEYLHPGINNVELGMEDFWKSASLHIEVSPWDKWSLAILALTLVAIASTLSTICWVIQIRIGWPEMGILYGGAILQSIYLLGTPYFLRAYDIDGHLEYIQYVANHARLPNPHLGWETYQPPLYYLLTGGLTCLGKTFGMFGHQLIAICQWFSWLCTVGCLATACWIAEQIYQNKMERYKKLLFLCIIAVFPSLVCNVSRISNDVLLNLFAFIWLACLISFWKHGDFRSWVSIFVILSLGLLTKASMLPLVLISLCSLAFVPGLDTKRKALWSIAAIGVCLTFAGWYYIPRAFYETGVSSYFVGNINHLNPSARISHVLGRSLVFNPFKILRYPFVFPWGPRHQYFLEYYFKSAFVGEWWLSSRYKWLARALMAFAVVLLPILIIGIMRSIRNNALRDLPLIFVLLGLFVAQWLFVQIAPFLSSQDFRYVVVLIVPIAYFLVNGIASMPERLRLSAFWALQILMINCVVYLIASSVLN